MKRKRLSNQELAEIERSLFKSVQANQANLDAVLDSPDLFNSIKRQIKRQQPESEPTSSRFWLVGYAFASVLVILLSGYFFVNLPPKVTDESVSVPQPKTEFQPIIEEKFQPISDVKPKQISENKPHDFVKKQSLKITKTVKKEIVKPKTLPFKPAPIKRKLPQRKQILPEIPSPFYALNGGNFDSLAEGTSIVRGDFSRAELFAMGVEVLNDIGDSRVRAEVLIGDNGQPRAIRILR